MAKQQTETTSEEVRFIFFSHAWQAPVCIHVQYSASPHLVPQVTDWRSHPHVYHVYRVRSYRAHGASVSVYGPAIVWLISGGKGCSSMLEQAFSLFNSIVTEIIGRTKGGTAT